MKHDIREHIAHLPALASPTPQQVKEARKRVDLTQREAGALLRLSLRGWQQYEGGQRDMPPATFEFFVLLTSLEEVRAARLALLKKHRKK